MVIKQAYRRIGLLRYNVAASGRLVAKACQSAVLLAFPDQAA
ncbi:hypothetical protein [Neisseria elongata]|nr:hypothetical protein [Neisseria elongata]